MLTTFLAQSPKVLAGEFTSSSPTRAPSADASSSPSPFPSSSGCSIAIHSLYGLSIGLRQPYSDTHADAHTNTYDDLDLLAMFHSVVQVVVLILGLAANEGNAVTVSVLVFTFAAAGMAASAAVSALSWRAQKNVKRSFSDQATVTDPRLGASQDEPHSIK